MSRSWTFQKVSRTPLREKTRGGIETSIPLSFYLHAFPRTFIDRTGVLRRESRLIEFSSYFFHFAEERPPTFLLSCLFQAPSTSTHVSPRRLISIAVKSRCLLRPILVTRQTNAFSCIRSRLQQISYEFNYHGTSGI